jgi:hypothetical protein
MDQRGQSAGLALMGFAVVTVAVGLLIWAVTSAPDETAEQTAPEPTAGAEVEGPVTPLDLEGIVADPEGAVGAPATVTGEVIQADASYAFVIAGDAGDIPMVLTDRGAYGLRTGDRVSARGVVAEVTPELISEYGLEGTAVAEREGGPILLADLVIPASG